ncbi:MAG: sigma-70 family RNA polymerase sigma factor [Actinomycetota bacterium]
MTASDLHHSGPRRLTEIYDEALPAVFDYLARRCGSVSVAEDLTSSTFVSAALAIERQTVERASVPWLMTIARNKLVDHWRREAVARRSLELVAGSAPTNNDPWDEILDAERARRVLHDLDPHHRTALVLRYLDDLSVPETAAALGRSVRATESLLARARARFRASYAETEDHDA